jgi:hypothetical protein
MLYLILEQMKKSVVVFLSAALVTAGLACRAARPNLAPRPEALGFPLMEASALPFEGTANGPVTVRYGVAYFTTIEGSLYSIDVLSRRILWRFKADGPVPAAPELGDDSLLLRDERNSIYVLNLDGRVILKTASADPVTTPVRERRGRIYYGCGNGRIAALDLLKNGRPVWEFEAGARVSSGPVFSGAFAIFGTEDGRLIALNDDGRPCWTFAAKGAIRVDPAAAAGDICFGTSEHYFYGLAAATGKKKWLFRLGGAPLHPPVIVGKRLVFAASDSIVYCLSARSGEILWWQAVPSRVILGPSMAEGIVLVPALSPGVFAYDLRAGRPIASYRAENDLQAGAQWVTPYLFLIETDPTSGGERIVFLKHDRRPVKTSGEASPIRR